MNCFVTVSSVDQIILFKRLNKECESRTLSFLHKLLDITPRVLPIVLGQTIPEFPAGHGNH